MASFRDHLATAMKNNHHHVLNTLETVVEPLAVATIPNAAALYGLAELSQKISEEPKNALYISSYIAGASALALLNAKAIIPLSKKIARNNWKKLKTGAKRKAKEWILLPTLLAAIGASSYGVLDKLSETANDYHSQSSETSTQLQEHSQIKPTLEDSIVCNTDGLKGTKLSGLYSDITGIHTGTSSTVPDTVIVNPKELLGAMWEKKKTRSKGNNVVNQVIEKRVKPYLQGKERTLMTLDEYIKEADESIAWVNKHIDWEEVSSTYNQGRKRKISQKRFALVKDICESLSGKDLLAYAMTELMPSTDGDINSSTFNFVLENFGREYLELIPAMHDNITSFGPYQFTPFAVFQKGKEYRGASRINKCLNLSDEKKVPNSVMLLKGNDHHKVAYEFAIHNLTRMIASLNEKEFDVLQRKWRNQHESIVQYIAAAHHQPTIARKRARWWLDNDANLPFRDSCTSRLRNYTKKTSANLRGLNRGLYRHH